MNDHSAAFAAKSNGRKGEREKKKKRTATGQGLLDVCTQLRDILCVSQEKS
jgi:hypothetical protein